jgi:hypothetical protein
LPSLESQLDFRSLCVRIFSCSSFLGPAQCPTREILDLAPGWSRSGALIREQGSPVQASTLPQPIRFLRSPDFQSPLAPRWSVSGFWTTRRSAQLVLPAERAASFEFSCRRPSFSFPAHRFGLRAQGTSSLLPCFGPGHQSSFPFDSFGACPFFARCHELVFLLSLSQSSVWFQELAACFDLGSRLRC